MIDRTPLQNRGHHGQADSSADALLQEIYEPRTHADFIRRQEHERRSVHRREDKPDGHVAT